MAKRKKSTSGRSLDWLTENTAVGVFAIPNIDWLRFNSAFELLYDQSNFFHLQSFIYNVYNRRGSSDYFENDVAIVFAIVDGLITKDPKEVFYIDGKGRIVPSIRKSETEFIDLEPRLVEKLLSYFNVEMRKYGFVNDISSFIRKIKQIYNDISKQKRKDYEDFVFNEVITQTSYKVSIDEKLYYYVDSLFDIEKLSRYGRFDKIRAYVSSLEKWLGFSVWFDDLYQQAVKLVTVLANKGGIPPRDFLKRQLETKLLLRILSSSEDERVDYYRDVWEHFEKQYEYAIELFDRFKIEYINPLSLDYAGECNVMFSSRVSMIIENIMSGLQYFEDLINNRDVSLYNNLQLPSSTFEDFYKLWRDEYSAYMCRPGMSRLHYIPFPDDEKMCEGQS